MTTNPRAPVNPANPDSVTQSNFPPGASISPPVLQTITVERTPQSRLTRWLRHIALLLFVLFCAILGMWLTLLPWSLQWTDNPLLWTHPDLRAFLAHGFVRGVCSGLGLLDLWIGIREAAHYYEHAGILK